MGQKVSPEIFRIQNLNNNWKSKYIENKTNELSSFFFKSLEIKNFIKRFMKFHGLTVHNCKLALSNTSLHLIISYYVTNHASTIINRRHANNNSIVTKVYKKKKKEKAITKIKNIIDIYYYNCFFNTDKKNNYNKFKKRIGFKYLYLKKNIKKKILKKKSTYINYFKSSYFRRQLYYVMQLIKKKIKTKKLRSKYIKKSKQHYNITKYKNTKNIKKNNFTENFLENLAEFVGKKYLLFITLKNLKINNIKESYLIKDAKFIRNKIFFKLYKYKKSKFFEITKRTIFLAVRKSNSAQFLADFISFQLNRLKKEQYFFLKCIKSILTTLLKGTVSSTKLSGIKINISGRLKKARRAKNRTFKITVGRVPLQSINSNISHAKATSYTINGTFGTEVWINYFKNPNKLLVTKVNAKKLKKHVSATKKPQ